MVFLLFLVKRKQRGMMGGHSEIMNLCMTNRLIWARISILEIRYDPSARHPANKHSETFFPFDSLCILKLFFFFLEGTLHSETWLRQWCARG